jgi:hypothetical protein
MSNYHSLFYYMLVHSLLFNPLNAGIKSLCATLPDKIFITGDFAS